MALTPKHHELAQEIDIYVRKIFAAGGGDEEILTTMVDYMPSFKQLLDTSKQGEVDLLCQQYDGFYHFAKLLESLAQAIADGAIVVPPEENRPAV
ncbi:MAG TPA: arylsulfatase regulator [Chloroflexota bacterium]|nr:arylsulfatase regulator [Chloroflexota bacterium]HUM67346.1 arylsulfatase regulator [Chloroflexota bacterium]